MAAPADYRTRKRPNRRANDGMTMMLVPHNKKHVLKIRLNFRLLYFSLGLLLGITLLALISFFSLNNFLVERDFVLEQARGWNNKIWHFDHNQQKLVEKIKMLRQRGQKFYDKVWSEELPVLKTTEIPPDKILSYQLTHAVKPLKHALDFLITRERALQALPLGWPVKSGYISSSYGARSSSFSLAKEFHTGYDFATAHGTPIYATADGRVLLAGGGEGGLGLRVKLLHKHGFISVYAHCSKLLVTENQRVKRGHKIALLGRTGNATGPHVHYEIKLKNPRPGQKFEVHQNPGPFIRETL